MGKQLSIVLFFTLASITRALALCVTSDIAILRSGPSIKDKAVLTVGKYTPLVKTGQSAGWYQVVDLDNERYWIGSGHVSHRMKCLAIQTKSANLRTGPGQQFEFAAYKNAELYTPFKILTRKDNWFQVVDASGNKAWVHEANVWQPKKVMSIGF